MSEVYGIIGRPGRILIVDDPSIPAAVFSRVLLHGGLRTLPEIDILHGTSAVAPAGVAEVNGEIQAEFTELGHRLFERCRHQGQRERSRRLRQMGRRRGH